MRRKILLVVVLLCLSALLATLGYTPLFSAASAEQVVTSTETNISQSMSPAQAIFKGPFTVLSTTGTNLPCEFWISNFTTTAGAPGEYVSGNFTSDNPVSFFIVQQAKYENWLKEDTCGTMGDAITSQLITTSYAFNAAIPSPGAWLIVLVNSSNAKNADGFLVAYLSTLSYTVTELITSTITMITSTIRMSTTIQPTSKVTSQLASVIGIIGIIVGIAVGLLALLMSRHKRTESRAPA